MADTLRDELEKRARGAAGCSKPCITSNDVAEVCPCSDVIDACLALLRSRIPGFDALIEGSAVVVPAEPEGEMILDGDEALNGWHEAREVYLAMLAASPYAQREAK